MALKKLLADLSIISKLGTNPGIDDGLSEEQLKAKFDEAANLIKDYINNYLIGELDKTVDVEALLSDILDITLSKPNKAASAAATGDAFRKVHSLLDKTGRSGDYVLESDGRFAAEKIGENAVRIFGGEGVMLGNLFSLNVGSCEDIELGAGTYGLNRADIVAVRCTKNDVGALGYAIVVLTGENTSGEPVDPVYKQEDVNADGTIREFPMYRIKFEGYDMSIEPMFFAGNTYPATLSASGWIGSGPYTQTITVPGLMDGRRVMIYPAYGDDVDANIAMQESCAAVSYAKRNGRSIVFTCLEDKPDVDINVILEVYV